MLLNHFMVADFLAMNVSVDNYNPAIHRVFLFFNRILLYILCINR